MLTLTSSNFTKTIKAAQLILVQFFSLGCPHCQQLAPEYEAAARSLQSYGILLAKVNGPEEKELVDNWKVPGWPTLKIFRKGRVFEYKGPRDREGIVDYMKEQNQSPSKLVHSFAELKSEMDRTETTVIGYFTSKKSHIYTEFLAAAHELRGTYNRPKSKFNWQCF